MHDLRPDGRVQLILLTADSAAMLCTVLSAGALLYAPRKAASPMGKEKETVLRRSARFPHLPASVSG